MASDWYNQAGEQPFTQRSRLRGGALRIGRQASERHSTLLAYAALRGFRALSILAGLCILNIPRQASAKI
jgi:hypothetical protein